jgi:hypothetical protein
MLCKPHILHACLYISIYARGNPKDAISSNHEYTCQTFFILRIWDKKAFKIKRKLRILLVVNELLYLHA